MLEASAAHYVAQGQRYRRELAAPYVVPRICRTRGEPTALAAARRQRT